MESTLSGGGEMGALMRSFDWSQIAIGPVAAWPQSLKTAVRIILTSRYAMFVWWGRELVNLYNDPYRAFLGAKHPEALGKSAREVWAEIWNQIGPRAEAVLLRGSSTYDEALLLMMERHGYLEETYFTFSYSPLPDDQGNVGGLFCAVTEETQRVIGQRRLALLREIAAAMAESRTPTQVCEAASRSLSSARRDLPFSMIYLFEGDSGTLKRAAEAGIAGDHSAAPDGVDLDDDESVWPFRQVIESGEAVLIERLSERIAEVPRGEWSRSPECAVLVPIAQQGQVRPAGILVAGLNPHREFDDDFRGFVSLLANQIAAGIANAVAYETERRRAELLAQLDHAKNLFFSNVSHEFRTPLTLMLGPLEELLENSRERLSRGDQEQLIVVHRNALRLLRLVNTLLDFSRIEAGRAQAIFEPTDLSHFTAEMASVFQSAMDKAGLRFSVECGPLPEPVYVDRDMWEKIVLNLLSNAFKFTFEGGVSVRLQAVDEAVELVVSDTGVGIPEQELQKVFERFHRVESTRARTYEGTGIGLALVQELVRLHEGTVRVDSMVGKGSTFAVRIPRGKAHLPADRIEAKRTLASTATSGEMYVDEAQRWLPQDSGAALDVTAVSRSSVLQTEPIPSTTTRRNVIVLADDNADMREYLKRLLSEQYEVHAVADGAAAVEAARQLEPALVLTDVMMPHLDGFGVLHAIRSDSKLSSIPVILLSARAGEDARVEGLQAAADDYLVKPFTARELVARVATHIRLAAARREVAERESRLRAEAELDKQRLQELLAQAPAAIAFMSGPEHRWTFVNDSYVQVTGRKSAEDFLGKTVREGLPELTGQGFFELMDQVYRTGESFSGWEMKIKLNRGGSGQPEEAYFNLVYQPIRDRLGAVEGILVQAIEVTDQVTAHRISEENEERLRLAQSAVQIGTWEWDPLQNTRTFSDALHRMFGTNPEEPHPRQVWASRVHPADLQRVQDQAESGYREGSMEFAYRYHHPQQGLRWFYCKGRRLKSDSRMVGVILDITDRKQVEEARNRLAAIVESTDDAIISKDLSGIVTSWNAGAEKTFGYAAAEIIGRPITVIIPPELHDDEKRILEAIARNERIDHFETVRMTRSGERIDVSLTISPVRDETGRVIGAAKIARDITQRKKAEQALRTTERLASVGRLAATMAHEINNPLEAVVNLVYLAKSIAEREDLREYLTVAEEELGRVSQLTRQTLGFYRDTRGTTSTNLASQLLSLLSVFSSRARNKAIEIRPEIRQNPEIVAVPGEIRQLMANLLSNSIDAIHTNGVIRIRVSAATQRKAEGTPGVRLTVADSGPGIPVAIRSNLFEPFFTSNKEVGTGLGLWVCKSIVEKHGGDIRVKSCVTPGRSWTVFSVFLPLKPDLSTSEPGLQHAA